MVAFISKNRYIFLGFTVGRIIMKRIILFIVAVCISHTFAIYAMERNSVDVFFSDNDENRQLTLIDYSNSHQKLTAVYHIRNLGDESFISLLLENNPLEILKNKYGFKINPENGEISLLDTFDPSSCVIRTNTLINKSNVHLHPSYKIDITRVEGLDSTYKNILRTCKAKTFNQHCKKSADLEKPFTVDFFPSNPSTLEDLKKAQNPLLDHIVKTTTALLLIEYGYDLLIFPGPYQIFTNGDLVKEDFPDCFVVESKYYSVPISAEERMQDTLLSEEEIFEVLEEGIKNGDSVIAQNAKKVRDFINQTDGCTFKFFHQIGASGVSKARVEVLNSIRFRQVKENMRTRSSNTSSASSSLSTSPTRENEEPAK